MLHSYKWIRLPVCYDGYRSYIIFRKMDVRQHLLYLIRKEELPHPWELIASCSFLNLGRGRPWHSQHSWAAI